MTMYVADDRHTDVGKTNRPIIVLVRDDILRSRAIHLAGRSKWSSMHCQISMIRFKWHSLGPGGLRRTIDKLPVFCILQGQGDRRGLSSRPSIHVGSKREP